jgi:hypothetical protein
MALTRLPHLAALKFGMIHPAEKSARKVSHEDALPNDDSKSIVLPFQNDTNRKDTVGRYFVLFQINLAIKPNKSRMEVNLHAVPTKPNKVG